MNVIADGAEITVATAVHDEGFVTSAEQVAEEFVAAIEARGVGAKKPFHPGYEIRIGRFDDEMKMIAHETIRMNLPIGLGASLGERDEKLFVIEIVAKDGFTMVATIHDVIDRAGIFDAQRTGHGTVLLPLGICVNSED